MIKIGVKVMPRKEVLDTQGRAVENTLRQSGQNVSACRVGRYVVLEFDDAEKANAMTKAKEIAENVLHNPLIENYELESLGTN
jgi:phosphoribosylformylglycinamidine synthase